MDAQEAGDEAAGEAKEAGHDAVAEIRRRKGTTPQWRCIESKDGAAADRRRRQGTTAEVQV